MFRLHQKKEDAHPSDNAFHGRTVEDMEDQEVHRIGELVPEPPPKSRRRLFTALGLAGMLLLGMVVVVGESSPTLPTPEPEPSASVEVSSGPLLSPEGFVVGLTLGSVPPGDTVALRDAGGCEILELGETTRNLVGSNMALGTHLESWYRGGVLVGLTMVLDENRVETKDGLPRTWLGPTLGDPISAAGLLPESTILTQDPLEGQGPLVNSVVVPAGENEIVYSDVSLTPGVDSSGTITHIMLRSTSGRACRALPGPFDATTRPEGQGSVHLMPRGTATIALGDSVADLVARGVLAPEPIIEDITTGTGIFDPLSEEFCSGYQGLRDPGVQVIHQEDRVTAILTRGASSVSVSTGVELGDPLSDLTGAGVQEEEERYGQEYSPQVDVALSDSTRLLVLSHLPPVELENIPVMIPGAPLIGDLTLYEGTESASALC